ncbi:hypothetical protein M2103_001059 [Ereboglobus sp. PH5-5]|uniref:hypothetical protein n=1 Tax=Ereboglobus sp. PH5-5 TaxID=2940529 RepID=UPI002406F4B4|nr:hypothetical protein [Ereboglobus sp. PH5-5]MDF9832845.1 hypothetical protein [Ereboglobus sp. PH5-5]
MTKSNARGCVKAGKRTGLATPRRNLPGACSQVIDFRIKHGFQHFDKVRLHELELIGNIKNVDGRKAEIGKAVKARRDRTLMLPFHDKNNIGPAKIVLRNAAIRVNAHAGGTDFDTRIVAINPLGGHTAPPVHCADKEYFQATRGHWF